MLADIISLIFHCLHLLFDCKTQHCNCHKKIIDVQKSEFRVSKAFHAEDLALKECYNNLPLKNFL